MKGLGFSPEVTAATEKIRRNWTEQDYRERYGLRPYEIPQYGYHGPPQPTREELRDKIEDVPPTERVDIGDDLGE